MISAYNTRAENQVCSIVLFSIRSLLNVPTAQGLSRDEMFAYQGNLCVPEDESPAAFSGAEFYNFDIAAVGLGFHVSTRQYIPSSPSTDPLARPR
jgi:hypothetical protein